MIHGDDIYVMTDVTGTLKPVAASKSCSIQIGQNTIDACSPTNGRTKIKIPTDYKWSVSCENLLATETMALYFLNAIKSGATIMLIFSIAGQQQRGHAVVTSCDISAAKNSLAKFNVSFEGSGELHTVTAWHFSDGNMDTHGTYSNLCLVEDATFTDGNLSHHHIDN